MSNLDLPAQLEAILFAASDPLSIAKLVKLTDETENAIRAALETLESRLTHGIRLSTANDTYRLVTAPEAASLVSQLLEDTSRQDLSRAALETLAIIAYRGPITKNAIEEIRGVASETMVRNLIARGLIESAGRSSEPGRPVQYAISHVFLQHFGLTSTEDLPPLPGEEPNEN